jgi:hypothetical protein
MKSKKKIKLKKNMNKTIVSKPNKNVQNEVNRILKQNMSSMDLNESHIPFVSRFLKTLIREAEETIAPEVPEKTTPVDGKSPEEFTPETNQQDFEQSLEPSTDPNQFETEGVPSDVTSDTINSIKQWSDKLNEFAEFLNDPSTNSLHKILADGDRAGSLLRGVTRKASDSITRIAGEVEKLKEILNTYIITAPKKLRDTEQLKAGS